MNIIRKSLITAALILHIAALASATNHGSMGGQILGMYTSARILGMGNAGVAIVNDVNSVIYNPAGLRWMSGSQVQMSHVFYYMGTTFSSISAAHNFGEDFYNLGIGCKIKYFGLEDTLRNSSGQETDTFEVKYMQYVISGAIPLKYKHSVGISLKSITEEIYKDSGNAFLFDIGWQYNFSERKYYRMLLGNEFGVASFKNRRITEKINIFGAAVRNVGGAIATGGGSSDLPMELAVGGAHGIPRLQNLVVTWEAVTGKEAVAGLKCGVESEFQGFKARAGVIYLSNPQITLGFGIPEENWHLDYGLFWHLDMGLAHRLSVGASF